MMWKIPLNFILLMLVGNLLNSILYVLFLKVLIAILFIALKAM